MYLFLFLKYSEDQNVVRIACQVSNSLGFRYLDFLLPILFSASLDLLFVIVSQWVCIGLTLLHRSL